MKTDCIINNLPAIVGKGYGSFWRFRGRYRVVKGSRASKKSKTTALWYITNLMKYPQSNLLVIRKTFRTLKDSCYTELKWAVNRLNVGNRWEFKESPLEITYKPTGQKIYFRGLDDPLKVTSIAVDVGCLCWMWIEEAYEINSESDFDTLDESIRGDCPEGLFKQVTITFNPWNEHHWLKKRFFDVQDPDVLALTTNYLCNEWLDDADLKVFQRMKENNPRRYAVAGLGGWGVVDGLVYENFVEQTFDFISKKAFLKLDEAEQKNKNWILSDDLKPAFGLDFGFTNDPSAFFCGMLDEANHRIYVFDELYESGLLNSMIYEKIKDMGYSKEKIVADSAEAKSIAELRQLGLYRIKGAEKGKGSINAGIQFIQNFQLVIHPRCCNFLTEVTQYTWKTDKFGKKLNEPVDESNHLMDAMRYALESYIVRNGWLI